MNDYPSRLIVLTVAWLSLCGAGAGAFGADSGDVAGHDWPQWRGPYFNGSSDATNLPDKFSPTDNCQWTAKLPGSGNGTPVVAGGRIYLTAIDPQSKKLAGLCLDQADGHILWQKEMGIGFKDNNRNNMTSPSAVTDGQTVYFYFGTGDLSAFDRDGKALWSRNIQKDQGDFNFMWLYGSSPLLYKGKLYLQCLHNDISYDHRGDSSAPADSYLLAIDPRTGKDLWKQIRPTEAAGESKEAYTTPIPVETSAGPQIILVGGDCVTGHDPDTGKELWRYGTWNPTKINHWRMVTSAVGGEGFVFACAPKGGPVMAVKEGASGKVPFEGAAWETKNYSSDVCVPLIYHHLLYILDGDKKTLYCVDPKTAEPKWQGQLQLADAGAPADAGGRPGRKGRGAGPVFRASPSAADGKIYCINEVGDLWVISADEFKILNQVSLGGKPVRSSIVLTDGQVLVRAGDQLFAFGKK
jgi:outer membrane protein assembly factor BamB